MILALIGISCFLPVDANIFQVKQNIWKWLCEGATTVTLGHFIRGYAGINNARVVMLEYVMHE